MSLRDWFNKRREKRAQRKLAAQAMPKKKRHYGIKIAGKVFLCAHFALATQYPASLYEIKLPDMASGAIAATFSEASKKIPDRYGTFPAFGDLPQGCQRVLNESAVTAGAASGSAFYDALPSRYKAATLNMFAKSEATWLPDGKNVLDHLHSLREIDQDRIFVNADGSLAAALDAGAQDGQFSHRGKFGSSLHHGEGTFKKYASYKSDDQKGNLDITLSHDGTRWMAEIDIDYYKGWRHFFQEVVYHHAFEMRTDPYTVGNILRNDQGIDPWYRPK